MSTSNHAPVAIDLFAGAGGLSEGLLAAGVNVAVAVEGHPHAALTLAFNHPTTSVICGDIRSLSFNIIRQQLRRRVGHSKVDLIVGGPPCQGFSIAGRQARNDPRNKLVGEFLRAIEHFKPRMFVFENVPGLAQFAGGKAIRRILDEFWRLGYQVQGIDGDSEFYPETYPMLNAARYGVPQVRRRLILVGSRTRMLTKPFMPPKGSYGADLDECIDRRVQKAQRPYVTIVDAISDLAFLPGGYESHAYAGLPLSNYQRSRRSNAAILFNHLATRHRPETVSMFRRIAEGATIRSIPKKFRSGKQRMSRLDGERASFAVLALPDDYIHYARHRIPTVRELARLQSFDDDYVFFGKRTTSDFNRQVDVPQYTQVGNAVPPLLAKALGRSLVRALGGKFVDLRQLSERRSRHNWVLGSSGYTGYTISNLARGHLVIFDHQGKAIELPFSTDQAVAMWNAKKKDWTKHRRVSVITPKAA